jgi:L-lactate dehydrogenase complex protein LldF
VPWPLPASSGETNLKYIWLAQNRRHIIAPACTNRGQIGRLSPKPREAFDEPGLMTREAREVLRGHFLSADLGISGGNFLIAETGSLALVTNEGNGRMVTTLPRVHIAITGIEKVVPTLEDLSTLMRLLPRSATGQSISNYFSVVTGTVAGSPNGQPREGPEHMYFVLVDNGRTRLVGSDLQSMLRCIRCGACMTSGVPDVGGHSTAGSTGTHGFVLTPYFKAWKMRSTCQAATMCGACSMVCRSSPTARSGKLREQRKWRKAPPCRKGWACSYGHGQRADLVYAFATR